MITDKKPSYGVQVSYSTRQNLIFCLQIRAHESWIAVILGSFLLVDFI